MDGYIFNVNDWNEFTRYVGTSIKDIKQEKVKVFGLVQGINEPPINNFFHWCHSILVYQTDIPRKELDKMLNMEYQDITNRILNRDKKEYKVIEQNYYIDEKNNKYIVDGKNVIMKHTEKEKEVAKILGEIYGGKVKIIPAVLNPQHIKTPDYMIKNIKYDLKEPTGSSKTTIYDLFKHKSKQANNFVIDIHKSGLDRLESIEQTQQLFYSTHRKWIDTIILMEDNEIFKILKRK